MTDSQRVTWTAFPILMMFFMSFEVSLTWYCLVLKVVLSYHMAIMPVYIEKSGDFVGCYHRGTDERPIDRTRKDRATQPIDHGRLR